MDGSSIYSILQKRQTHCKIRQDSRCWSTAVEIHLLQQHRQSGRKDPQFPLTMWVKQPHAVGWEGSSMMHVSLANILLSPTCSVGLRGRSRTKLAFCPSQSFRRRNRGVINNESNKNKTMQKNKWQQGWEEEGELGDGFLSDHRLSMSHMNTQALKLQRLCCVISSCVCSFLAQRKELGVLVYNCSCLALDLHRVFSFYWQLHERDYIPSIWSKRVTALYGRHDALELQLNGSQALAYVSVRINSVMLPHLFTCHPVNWLCRKCTVSVINS